MRATAAVVLLCAVMFCNGCIVIGASVAAIGALVAVEAKKKHQPTPPAPAGTVNQETSKGSPAQP